MRVSEGVREHRRQITVDDRHAVFGPTVVRRLEFVKESLTNGVRWVVLVDSGPPEHGVPYQLIDPGILKSGSHESGWIPSERVEGGIDAKDAETETAMDERIRFDCMQLLDRAAHVLCRLGDPLLRNNPDALSGARLAKVPNV